MNVPLPNLKVWSTEDVEQALADWEMTRDIYSSLAFRAQEELKFRKKEERKQKREGLPLTVEQRPPKLH